MVQWLNDYGFSERVLEGEGYNGVAFLDHFSIPCDHFRPELEALSAQFEGKISFYQVDVVESPSLTEYMAVQATPTLILFQEGREVIRYEGAYSREALQEKIQEAMRTAGQNRAT